ncbi:glycerate dehydrogenase [Desulfomarina profundi]|uniref:Glycerate dehydrogenase n=1 Tax=Desulfomarina profundi TaxID=2772557 RepID=A0A8D5JMY8_9BACT|nr:D-2-hydroxyacid dehydrogenase [Desulfomarina profundi]BCL59555.1 glycerate dehydrogenase [Desulfomarina profundi]
MKTVFLDTEGLNDLSFEALREECSSFRQYSQTPPEKVIERIKDTELIILNKVKINRKHLQHCPSLKLICLVATGTDVVDLQAAKQHNITVCNCQAYGTDSVAQHVFASLLALFTNLLSYERSVRKGSWQKASQFCYLDYPITELRGKTMGIIGYGNNGRRVAELARAFGMRVEIGRRPGSSDSARPTLRELAPALDVLTLHCPLTPETRNLVNDEILALMKPTAFLINTARGGIVDEEALLASLKNGKLAGAATDVLTVEPPVHSNPLIDAQLPNLIITPHVAWASREAREEIIHQTLENIKNFKNGHPIRTV